MLIGYQNFLNFLRDQLKLLDLILQNNVKQQRPKHQVRMAIKKNRIVVDPIIYNYAGT